MDSTPTNPPPTSPPPAPPETFHHYQVLRREDESLWELGRGAMGVTYKAFDVNLRVPVALKVVNPQTLEDDTARARFVREARAAARLRHRNVASVHHLGQEGQNFFYAMEFVDGETLESLVRREGPLPTVPALRLAMQVVRALAAAHREGLVHRDIKPANLMIVPDEDEDGGLLVKVIDFGLARVALGAEHHTLAFSGANSLSSLTHAGFVGTPLFASPEQLEEKEVDIRSDIYSLGVTLWHALAAAPPFTGSLAGIISQHLTKEPPWEKLEMLSPPVPAPVRALLARMLEKNRDGRPADPAALRRELEDCLRGLSQEEADAPAPAPAAAEPGRTFAPRPLPGTENPPLAGRYRLERAVGEGSAGRVFLAWDVSQGGRPTAVKMLHADLLVSPADEAALAETVSRAREAAHPNLVEVRSLEQDGRRHFLTQEWLRGFNLVALLRSRGALPAEDVLPLLDAAAAAFDHARASGLPVRRLELGLHQVMLHFPPVEGEDDPVEFPAIPDGPLAAWPTFALKIDPLGIGRDAAGGDPLLTWAGDQTLVPASPELAGGNRPRVLTRDTHSSVQGLENGAAPGGDDDLAEGLRGLAQLVYLLLGGAVQPPSASVRYATLPALNERANIALRRGLLAEPPVFGSAREFAEALRGARPAIAAVPVLLAPPVAREPEIASPLVRETPPPPVEEPSPAPAAYPVLPRSSAATIVGGTSRARIQPWREQPEAGDSGGFAHASTASGSPAASIAHLIDPPPRRGGSPVLGAIVALGLLALLGLGCWGLMSFLLSSPGTPARDPRSSSASTRRGTTSPAARPPRDVATVPATPEPVRLPPPTPRAAPTEPASSIPPRPLPSPAPALAPTPPPRAETPPARAPLASPSPGPTAAAVAVAPALSRVAPAPAPASTPAERRVRVNLFSDPPGAEIILSGELLGVTGTKPLSVTLPPGEYTVRARYADWPETTQTLRVPPKGVEAVDTRIRLTPPRGAAAPGASLPPDEGGSAVLLPEPERPPAPRRTPEPPDPSESQARPAIVVPRDGADG